MNPPKNPFAELDELAWAWCNGLASPEQAQRLESLLLESAEARQRFGLYMHLQSIVERFAEDLHPSSPQIETIALDTGTNFDAIATVALAENERVSRIAAPRRLRLRAWRLAGSVLAVGLLFIAYVVGVSWNMLGEKARDLRLEARGEPSPAYLIASEDARWHKQPQAGSPAASAANQSAITKREPLELTSGIVELKLKQGVTLRIEGPAEWTIDGKNSASLTRGKLLAAVPKQAIGFTLKTPTARIVDLGTEFGVTVDERGSTQTRVLKGEVKLHTSQPAEAPPLPAQRLTAGQAVRIDIDGRITPVRIEFATAEEFIRRPGTKTAAAESSHAYSRAVLATPGLIGYWRMGEDGTQGARDEVGFRRDRPLGRSNGLLAGIRKTDYRHPGALTPNTNPPRKQGQEDAAKDDYAIRFDGESYIEIDDHLSLSGDWDGLTLMAWIKPDRQQPPGLDEASLIVGKLKQEVAAAAYGLYYKHSGGLQLAVSNGRNPETGLIGAGNFPLGDGAFHFIVGTWEKASGIYRLYVDGRTDLAQGQQRNPRKLNGNSQMPVHIGGQRADNTRYFAGCIDEVSIFNRTLTAEEIGQLYRLPTDKQENEETNAHE